MVFCSRLRIYKEVASKLGNIKNSYLTTTQPTTSLLLFIGVLYMGLHTRSSLVTILSLVYFTLHI
nr:hypothetical protein Iba_chr06bCG17270 [Ipomoea batatas]